jgi:hypothetical protein
LDGFPELVDILREVCSHEAYEYMVEDVDLDPDKYLDMLHMVSHDNVDAVAVVNPPARIRRGTRT